MISEKRSVESAAFRQRHKYWLARLSEWPAPLLRWGRLARCGPATCHSQWTDLALVGADHIGDVLYRTVGLSGLKAALPGVRIHFVSSRPAAELLETHPAIDSVIIAEHAQGKRSFAERKRLLLARSLDAVLCYDTGDYWKDHLAVAQSGIPNCIGYTHKGFGGLVTHPLPFSFPVPYSESFRRSVESVAGRSIDCGLRPDVHLTAEDEAAGLRFARQFEGEKPLLAIGITGNQPQGDLLKERMLETLVGLHKIMKFTPIFLGAAGDREELAERTQRYGLRGGILCGDLRLRECVAFLKHAKAAFVVDSGLRHMANAAGIPVVYFRNLYTFRGETGNYLPTEVDLAPEVECLSREVLATHPPLFEVAAGVRALNAALS